MPLDNFCLAARLEALEATVQQLLALWDTNQIDVLSQAVLPGTRTVLEAVKNRLPDQGRKPTHRQSSIFASQCRSPSNRANRASNDQLQDSPAIYSSGENRLFSAAYDLLQYSASLLRARLHDCPYNTCGSAWATADFLQWHDALIDSVLCARVAFTFFESAEEAWKAFCDVFMRPSMVGH